ncbi:uncharacterized protein PAC_13666 [Phialocephala subalpina]|uniref:Nephrocystin 3-like N-terminal domain-containing protein n=1 Tax=Phialocephala subalpina TaxID=576137 RepID=A0A1L7XFE8_9HELO|nr:uncharacterized protein PAC_13666 [Phialocephala subalpina]
MLDPFSALGLTSNIIQFVDFGSKLVFGSSELYRSADGTSEMLSELSSITHNLRSMSSKLGGADQAESQLSSLAMQCKILADHLLQVLQDLAVGGRHRCWKTVRQALGTILKDKDVRDIERRLDQPYKSNAPDFHSGLLEEPITKLKNTHSKPFNKSSDMNDQIRKLSSLHTEMGVNRDPGLAELTDEIIQTLNAKVQEDQEYLRTLGAQLKSLENEGSKMVRQETVLASLSFKTLAVRRSRIVDSHPKTFDWIFVDFTSDESPPTNFPLWLREGSGIYWILGKAGSGNSTLMKYIESHNIVQSHLLGWADPLKLVTSTYYFWGAGSELQKSQIGLLRSLLHHILRQRPELIPGVCERALPHGSYSGREELNWSLRNLIEILEWLTLQQTFPVRFCFFVDGLDEYEGDSVKVINVLHQLSASPAIKLCVSSRP